MLEKNFRFYRWSFGFCCLFIFVNACVHKPKVEPQPTIIDTQIDELRSGAIDDLFVLQDYRAGKNSFVESPARHIGVWTEEGYRYTLLDVQGTGSIRHIWTTRGDGDPYFEWEFYIDGEKKPSIHGTDEELVRAAEQFGIRVAPGNAVPLGNRDFNIYLPIPFDKSIRIDVVQRQPKFWLWFCQIDYRLQDESLKGARLFSDGSDQEYSLSYVGLPNQQRQTRASSLPTEEKNYSDVLIEAGEYLRFASLKGPAIIRELRLQWPEDSTLRLHIRYDDAETFAVNAPLDRFFGPFQGVSLFSHAKNDTSVYLPMPFRNRCEILIRNEGTEAVRFSGKTVIERVPAFSPSWGYFHALHQKSDQTNGHRLHQVMYVRGRGHWVGMTLYKTGHDHGGGDFAVIDGEGEQPAFLHGINGEDYFTFAWFGKGAHHPYAVAHTNDEGRYRHHLENVYPFHESIAIEWGAFPELSPESVSFWYQDSPENTSAPDGAREDSVEWDVFGPVAIPYDERGEASVERFSVLPSIADLDAGKEYVCKLYQEEFVAGWMKDWSVGPMLNLTYIGRHKTKIAGEIELSGMGHAVLARRFVESEKDQIVSCLFANDDPIQVWVNDQCVFEGEQHFNGFVSTRFDLPLRKGTNEIVVKLTNYFNRNFNWTGFLMRLDGPDQ